MFNLLLAELKREWIILRRYFTETIALIIGLVVAFYGIFQSARFIAEPEISLGDRADSLVIGYILWSMSIFILGNIAGGLQQEAQTGTLEQLFISPFRASQIFLIRAIGNLTIQLFLNALMLLIVMGITGARLSFPPVLILPLAAVLLRAYGLAMAMGSLALLLKRVQQVLGIFQFLLFFVLMVPTETWSSSVRGLGWLLPMTPGAELLRSVMARGETLQGGAVAIALLNGAAYFILGLLLFRIAEREAKRRGKLSGY
uniref:ABC transporter permease n=1 Tax=Desertifilum tharense IPPAS B-1220 TaxID=1781255 RepID=A0ACD5GSE0_9CYAN